MTPATAIAPGAAPVADLMQHRLERALRQRVRYRYVQPKVLREGESFRIESPCCSRNVDQAGGVIDIALLEPGRPRVSRAQAGRVVLGWRLCTRDHEQHCWVPHAESELIDELLDLLCVDADRVFWP